MFNVQIFELSIIKFRHESNCEHVRQCYMQEVNHQHPQIHICSILSYILHTHSKGIILKIITEFQLLFF